MSSLFPVDEHAHARRTDPTTSHEAAARVQVTQTQHRVLACLIKGPATDDEIVARFRDYWPEDKTSPQSIRSRRAELVVKGLVLHDGTFGVSDLGGKSRKFRRA